MRVLSGKVREYVGTAEEREAFTPRRRNRLHRWYTPEGCVHEWIDGRWSPRRREAGVAGARVAVDVAHEAQHSGRSWRVDYVVDVGDAAAAYLHLRTGPKRAHLVAPTFNAQVAGCRVDFWGNQNVSAGVAEHPVIPYQAGGPAYAGSVYTDSTLPDGLDEAPGNRLLVAWQFGAPGGGPVASAGASGGFPWGPILEAETDYIWRLQEPDGVGDVDLLALSFDLVEDREL